MIFVFQKKEDKDEQQRCINLVLVYYMPIIKEAPSKKDKSAAMTRQKRESACFLNLSNIYMRLSCAKDRN